MQYEVSGSQYALIRFRPSKVNLFLTSSSSTQTTVSSLSIHEQSTEKS